MSTPTVTKLAGGMPWENVISIINDNFNGAIDSAQNLQAQPTIPQAYQNTSATLTPNTFLVTYFPIYAPKSAPTIVSFSPTVTVFVDGQNPGNQFPDGSFLTGGQKALRFSVVTSLTPDLTQFTPRDFTIDGTLFTVVGATSMLLNNADSVSHNYFVSYNTVCYSQGSSVFR